MESRSVMCLGAPSQQAWELGLALNSAHSMEVQSEMRKEMTMAEMWAWKKVKLSAWKLEQRSAMTTGETMEQKLVWKSAPQKDVTMVWWSD